MRFLLSVALASVCFISNASASDSSTALSFVRNALGVITTRTNNLTTAITAWDGKSLVAALNDIHIPSTVTIDYINNVTEQLEHYSDVSLSSNQVFLVGSPAQQLAYAVNGSIASLIRRKPAFESLSAGSIVISDLSTLLNASSGLSSALIKLIPSSLQPVATVLVSQNTDSLKEGIACFNGTNSSCYTAIADTERTYKMAIEYNAMNPDGSPYLSN